MPSLAKPFAVFGAAAGFFALLAVASFRPAAREVSPLLPTLVTAAAGAAVAATLRGWTRLHDPQLPREIVVFWVAALTSLAGAASGGAVGFLTWGTDGVMRFALGGFAVGLVFTPSCLVVFDAARRAGRARHGSLVADTDRRTVLSTVLAGVAFASATQAPAVLTAQASMHFRPLDQLLLSLVVGTSATAAIVLLQRRDRAARVALEAFAKDASWLDRVEESEEAPALPPGAVDLGLGSEHWARTTDSNYRTSGRAGVLVKGSVADATAAFEECARRRHRSLLVATCGLTAVIMSAVLRLSVLL